MLKPKVAQVVGTEPQPTPPAVFKKGSLAIGILTRNEAAQIGSCIESAQFADRIVVVDNGSTDATRAIANNLGAKVFQHPDWQGFAHQRNQVIAHAQGCEYLFFLDADERIPQAMALEIQEIVKSGKSAVWRAKFLTVAFGKAMPWVDSGHGTQRLFRLADLSHFEGLVHEEAQLHTAHLERFYLKERLLHYTRTNVAQSLIKLSQYSLLGAAKRRQAGQRGGVLRGLASGFSTFLKYYFFRRAFLYGAEGFLYAYCIANESFFRYAAMMDSQAVAQAQLQRP